MPSAIILPSVVSATLDKQFFCRVLGKSAVSSSDYTNFRDYCNSYVIYYNITVNIIMNFSNTCIVNMCLVYHKLVQTLS